ncbi:MAG: dethiobiotin synthase [Acidimicrobiales bacterium]
MLVVCTGTATEVGKTWVGAVTLAGLRAAGCTVSARKPAQSFDPDDAQPFDAAVLAEATGERPQDVCSNARTYRVAMAPPMAAAVLGQPGPTLAELVAELVWPDPEPDLRWVETVGGPRSPIAVDGDAVDLTTALRPDRVVLVADAGLGTINAVRLSVEPFRAIGHAPYVVLNRFDPDEDLHRRNAKWLADHDLAPLLGPTALVEALRADLAR